MPKQLCPSSRFDTIPACGRQTDRRTDRQTTTAYTAVAQRRAVKKKTASNAAHCTIIVYTRDGAGFDQLGLLAAPAPESSKQAAKKSFRGTWRAPNPRRRRRGVRGAKGRDAKGVEGVRNWDGVSPSPADQGVCGIERRKLPKWGPGQSPGEKRFYCFLSVSECLSLQRLLKITSFKADR